MPIDAYGQSLLEGAYENVEFPVESSDSEMGHDSVEHAAYLRDGADKEPTGWRALHGTLKVPMLNDIGYGTLWRSRYLDLIEAIHNNPLGQLRHPVHGIFTALINTVKVSAAPDNRSGVMLEITWAEHNATVTEPDVFAPAEDTPEATMTEATEADELGAAATTDYTPVAPVIEEQLSAVETEDTSHAGVLDAF